MILPFAQIDAFADRPFAGNPAAVLPLEHWLDDALLQAIAAENNLSETAFLVATPGGAADHELRWFTPSVEVALCGHATLASGHHVLSGAPELETVSFATRRAGILSVTRDAAGYRLALPAYHAAPAPLPAVLAALGVASAVETLWHPAGYALVVLAEADEVRRLAPDFRALARASGGDAADGGGGEPDILTIVTAPGDEAAGADVVSRVFAPSAGIDEDPVTGSAHAVLTPYWAARLGRNAFGALQASARGGRIACALDGERVVLGGRCVTVIEGRFRL